MTVEVVLATPAKIDGKIVKPDGKPIKVSVEIRDELIAAGAVVGGDIDVMFAEEPNEFLKAVAEEAENVAAMLVQEAVEKALAVQAGELATIRAENVQAIDLIAAAEARATKAEGDVGRLTTELAALKDANTEATKTPAKRVGAAKG